METNNRAITKDTDEQEVKPMEKKVITLRYTVKRGTGVMEANPTPLVKKRRFSTIGGRDRGFKCDLCPNSGATVNVVSEKMVNRRKLVFIRRETKISAWLTPQAAGCLSWVSPVSMFNLRTTRRSASYGHWYQGI